MERGLHVCPCLACRRDPQSLTAQLHTALNRVLSRADEKQRRWIAAMEAIKLGWGGIQEVARITGMDRRTVSRGIVELRSPEGFQGRVREKGGGRKAVEKKRPGDTADPQGRDER